MSFNSNKTPNQPPLSHFDKSFTDNPWDVLYCSLNDIEPIFTEMEFPEDKDFFQKQIIDPRNKLPVDQSLYDHTISLKPEIFRCPNRSKLSYKEHSICLAFLQSMKAKQQIFPHQIECFEKTAERRHAEQVEFLDFLSQYNNASFEKIYAPSLMLVELYQALYKREVQRLMEKHQDGIFQIHTGFPVPQKCGNVETLGTISDIDCVGDNRTAPPRLDQNLDFSKMKPGMEAYVDFHLHGEGVEEPQEVGTQAQYNISVEALVFLLSAGEYIDTPSEVVVEVVAREDGENVFHINDLLPSRNTGPHTAELITSISTEMFLKTKVDESPPEVDATDFKGSYQLQSIEDFVNSPFCSQNKALSCPATTSMSHTKWTLNLDNDSKKIHITSRKRPGYRDSLLKTRETFHSLKLEYKPQFGCEIISKATLLREWLQLQLSSSPDSSIQRYRINASTFKTVLQENLHLEDVELELERRYKVKTSRLLGSLGEFLGLLSNVGPGRYLLRYNPRFQEKLMLYAEVNDSTSKSSISLHSLLQETPSDLAFMTLRQLTPIDDVLCSAVHDFYKILPCAFPAGSKGARTTRRVIDDRNFIQKKNKAKMDLILEKQKKQKAKRNVVKRTKRAKKLKQKSKVAQEQQKDITELDEEIKNDRILFGFE
ncbi:little elongation complex subunit 2 [Eupeodes corollae]|uniref:little elongation complex subunit 2 n=1 Tax=Eupeodes corollae TaxID=290404 RepID=UPI0024937824|nr:little elongation complex subunit 2 [Eupeodes corollae]